MRSNQYHTDAQIRGFVQDQLRVPLGRTFEIDVRGVVDRRPAEGYVKVSVLYKFPYQAIDPMQCAQCGGIIPPPLVHLRLGKYPVCSPECAGTVAGPDHPYNWSG